MRREQLNESYKAGMSKTALTRMLFAGILIIVLAVSFTIFVAQEKETRRLLRLQDELIAQKAELEAQNNELNQLYSIEGSPEYIERIARDNLSMVAPEDIIIESK